MVKLLAYTRTPIDNVLYDPRLAYSMHLALYKDGKYESLNHNSGVLFPLATENENGSLNPMSLKNPMIFKAKEGYGVAAVRITGDGPEDETSKGSVVIWMTKDLVVYRELGMLRLCEEWVDNVNITYYEAKDTYIVEWQTESGGCYSGYAKLEKDAREKAPYTVIETVSDVRKVACFSWELPNVEEIEGIEGLVASHVSEITEEEADYLYKKLMTPVNTGIGFPKKITASCAQEVEAMKAVAFYSDGTTCEKKVNFDLSAVDFGKKGEYTLKGKVERKHFPFPVAFNRADPCVTRWNGKYYFIATNDADSNHTLYIRESDTITGLVDAPEILLLDSETYEGIGGLLWAPEFHEINGRLYIFHAATPGEFFWEESRLMTLCEGGDPACREDWSAPRKILKKDGSDLCEEGKTISLDMTCFAWEGDYYVIWSQREFLPVDLGAWLYIAKLDPAEPWKLLTDPVVLSKPDYGWANNHTFVEEGPFALIRGDKLYITFSGAAVDTSYIVSYLVIEKGQDLLDRYAWRKNNYPILTSRNVEGEFGTGHNAYVEDEDGVIWNTYHARPGTEGVRSSGIRRVHFDIDGDPVLDLTEEMDVKEEFLEVETVLTVQ